MFGKMEGIATPPESPMIPEEKSRVVTSTAPTVPTASIPAKNTEEFPGLTPEQITYLKGFSVAAFFAAPVWAICNRLYWHAIISLVFGQMGGTLFMGLYLGAAGRREAWKKGWVSFEAFRARQSAAAKICAASVFFVILLGILAGIARTL